MLIVKCNRIWRIAWRDTELRSASRHRAVFLTLAPVPLALVPASTFRPVDLITSVAVVFSRPLRGIDAPNLRAELLIHAEPSILLTVRRIGLAFPAEVAR
ncbi:hypothetical protein [Nocardia sp. NBC_01377]|uniref:hypothetical protein n=1 Tax=Nocardia sp. NBC_01377 TaxID=2903595 RepID=UPI00386AF5D2